MERKIGRVYRERTPERTLVEIEASLVMGRALTLYFSKKRGYFADDILSSLLDRGYDATLRTEQGIRVLSVCK